MEFILSFPRDPNPEGNVGKGKSILKTFVTSGSQYLGTSNIGCAGILQSDACSREGTLPFQVRGPEVEDNLRSHLGIMLRDD